MNTAHPPNVALKPTDVSPRIGPFDRFASIASHLTARAMFFTLCVLLVLLWAPTIFIVHNIDTWQLIINTVTTVVTFLLVALIQNSQTRSDLAIQHKLNAIADGLADFMDHTAEGRSANDLRTDIVDLRAAVGLELRESSSHNERDRPLHDAARRVGS